MLSLNSLQPILVLNIGKLLLVGPRPMEKPSGSCALSRKRFAQQQRGNKSCIASFETIAPHHTLQLVFHHNKRHCPAGTSATSTTALFRRPLHTRLPEFPDPDDSIAPFDHEAMQKTDSQAKSKMKSYTDTRRNAGTSPINLGDTVLVANDAKRNMTTPYDPCPVLEISGRPVVRDD